MKEKIESLIYSQNMINTYKSCPVKFKYKYIENINWKDIDNTTKQYEDSLIIGTEFHLICERYFTRIPTGINEKSNLKYLDWIQKIESIFNITENDSRIFLPEYEVKMKINKSIVSAKYDLIVIDKDKLEIWDWKTENKELEYKNVQNRMQTILYMYLAKEVIPKIFDIDIKYENISMNYYQPQFNSPALSIKYNENIHKRNGDIISGYIRNIKNDNCTIKNINHCKYCEFNKLCNNEDVKYDELEEEIYEC